MQTQAVSPQGSSCESKPRQLLLSAGTGPAPSGGGPHQDPWGLSARASAHVVFFPQGNKVLTPSPPCLTNMPRANAKAKTLSFTGCFKTDWGGPDPPEKNTDRSSHEQTPLRHTAGGVEHRLTGRAFWGHGERPTCPSTPPPSPAPEGRLSNQMAAPLKQPC